MPGPGGIEYDDNGVNRFGNTARSPFQIMVGPHLESLTPL